MADNELRANSLRLRFERGIQEPADLEIFRFMKQKMGLRCDKLLSMYKEKNDNSIIIKFKKEEDMRNTLKDLPETMEFEFDKYESVPVTLSCANAIMRYVRLFNLPPEINDKEISDVMGKFGKIVRLVREKYSEETGFPIWNSVRGVYLEVQDKCDIPPTIFIRNIRARVFYEGLVNRCFVCASADHLKASCPQKKSINDRLHAPNMSSYSAVLSNPNRWGKRIVQTDLKPATSNESSLNFTVLQPSPAPRLGLLKTGVPANNEHVEGDTQNKVQIGDASAQATIVNQQMEEACDSNDDDEHAPASGSVQIDTEINDVSQTEQLGEVENGGEDFVKVKAKRGKRQPKKPTGKRNTESENSTTDSDHMDGSVVAPNVQLSQSLDCRTRSRSKAKQRKMSSPGEFPTVGGSGHVDMTTDINASEDIL